MSSAVGTRKQWKSAALRTRDLPDPWSSLGFEETKEESVTRHMYNSRNGRWKTDTIVVKIQPKSFAHGAMRECFRMKKLSKFSQNPNWKNASNYVAKRYMKEVTKETYFDDVKLQMDSKLWGEEYSKLNVPKKVDFCQTYIIEFTGREGNPLYGVEHFIDGGYIKYNSNSGFVSDMNRLTPQAFSHFTFERSHHQLIIVDIQGVGDLYTDPQMHTVDLKDYGEANLGTRGMALFFSSHICNPLCEMMGLTQFDLSDDEIKSLRSKRWNFSSSTTTVSEESDGDTKETANSTLLPYPHLGSNNGPKHVGSSPERTSNISENCSEGSLPLDIPIASESSVPMESPLPLERLLSANVSFPEISINLASPTQDYAAASSMVILPSSGGMGTSASVKKVTAKALQKDKDSCESDLSILGQIHLDLARYHEVGRFSEDFTPNLKSSLYHLLQSAHSGVAESLYTVSRIYRQLLHDEFKELTVEATPEHECEGMDFLIRASERGLKSAMLESAKAFDTGYGLGKAPENNPSIIQRYQNWSEAVKWYSKAIATHNTEVSNSGSLLEPNYSIMKRMAEMYHSGGHQLEKDSQKAGDLYTEAADEALNAMKGKLSNKFYMLAEEAWSELTD